MDHFGTDWVVRSETEAVHSETAEDHSGTVGDHSGTEEAAHFEIGVGRLARFAVQIEEAAQTLDSEVDQSPAVVEETESAVAEKAVVAEGRIEEKQNRTNFQVHHRMAFAVAAAGEESLASQHNCPDSDPNLGSVCLAPFRWACCLHCQCRLPLLPPFLPCALPSVSSDRMEARILVS